MKPKGFPSPSQRDVRLSDNTATPIGFPRVSPEEQEERNAKRMDILLEEQKVIGPGKSKDLDTEIREEQERKKSGNPFKRTKMRTYIPPDEES